MYLKSPSKRIKVLEEKIRRKRTLNNKKMRKKNRNLAQKMTDLNYGENVDNLDMDSETFEMAIF